jgi:carbamoyl-phosphate synthase large subunit
VKTRGGISEKGRVIKDESLEMIAKIVANQIGLIGPSCMQFKENKNGIPMLTDLNPRIGGGVAISYQAGVNIPSLALEMIENDIDIPDFRECFVAQYFEEILIEEGS